MIGNTKYSFWWLPKPVTTALRRSTRAQKGTPTEQPYRNVMYDKRVVRGSNYGSTTVELEAYNKAAEWRRRILLRKKVLTRNQRNVIGTPPPVMGRRHEVIQTDKYLEDLLDNPPLKPVDTQTDLFLDPPPTPPPYVTSKIGVDVGTAIEPGDLTNCTVDDNDLPFLERFIEACITDTAQEIETEEDDKISDEITMTNLEDDGTNGHVMNSLRCGSVNEVTAEVTQIVDSREILTTIIEEIIKQRDEAIAEALKRSNEGGPKQSE